MLFRGLAPDEEEELFAHVRIRNFAAREMIFLKGTPGDSLMAVLRRNVRLSVPSPDAEALVIAILGTGEIFGDIALLNGKERTADAPPRRSVAWRPSVEASFYRFSRGNPRAWPDIVDMLCARLRKITEHVAELDVPQLVLALEPAELERARTWRDHRMNEHRHPECSGRVQCRPRLGRGCPRQSSSNLIAR